MTPFIEATPYPSPNPNPSQTNNTWSGWVGDGALGCCAVMVGVYRGPNDVIRDVNLLLLLFLLVFVTFSNRCHNGTTTCRNRNCFVPPPLIFSLSIMWRACQILVASFLTCWGWRGRVVSCFCVAPSGWQQFQTSEREHNRMKKYGNDIKSEFLCKCSLFIRRLKLLRVLAKNWKLLVLVFVAA